MSAQPAVVKVLDRTTVTGRDLLVLLAIAHFANPDGTNAWPTQVAVAKYARISKRSARRAITSLIGAGELAVDHKAGKAGANVYRVLCCARDVDTAMATSSNAARGQSGPTMWPSGTKHVANTGRHVARAVAPNHSIDHPSTTHDHEEGEEQRKKDDDELLRTHPAAVVEPEAAVKDDGAVCGCPGPGPQIADFPVRCARCGLPVDETLPAEPEAPDLEANVENNDRSKEEVDEAQRRQTAELKAKLAEAKIGAWK